VAHLDCIFPGSGRSRLPSRQTKPPRATGVPPSWTAARMPTRTRPPPRIA